MSILYQSVVKYVDVAFAGKQKDHFERTVYWIEQILPHATDAHRIAAYAHDIERAFQNKGEGNTPEDYRSLNFLRAHEERGAELIAEFLQKQNAEDAIVGKVKHMISRHEEGGDSEQDALMHADSLSFFETNAEMFVKKKVPLEGKIKVREKLDWMFNRIKNSDLRAKTFPNYNLWISELEKRL